MDFGFNFSFGSSLTPTGDSLNKVWQLPILKSREAFGDFLAMRLREGDAPLSTTGKADRQVLAWGRPRLHKPGFAELEIEMDEDGRVTSVKAAGFALRSIRVGKTGAFKPSLPAWPDVPLGKPRKGEMSCWMGMLSRAMEFISKLSGTTKPAARP